MADEKKRVDDFMSDDDLTAAAERIRESVDWSRLPKLAAIFEQRPAVNVYWHELVALTLTSLEVNGEALSLRNARAADCAPNVMTRCPVTAAECQGSACVGAVCELARAFHAHLDVCKQCREHPMALCGVGGALLSETRKG